MRRCLFCLAVLYAVMTFGAGRSAAGLVEGLHGDAAAAIAAEIGRGEFGGSVSVYVFYGDLTGTGSKDAVVFLYHPSGGNSDVLTTWIWRDSDEGYVLVRTASMAEVFGIDPRDAMFSKGRIGVTMTVPNPGDPRCCPTGKRKFTLSLDADVQSDGLLQELDVAVLEQGGDGQTANCASMMVNGLKAERDGFLAVRAGPSTKHRKIDELHNGDVVYVFEIRGKWAGIVYRTASVSCSSPTTRPVPFANKGWVHTNWLKDVAG